MRRSARLVLTFALVAATLPFTPATAQVTDHHLATWGDDTGPGTEAQPWRTFKEAFKKLYPGDTLTVHGGDYYGAAGWRPSSIPLATASNPIVVQAAPGDRPVLHGVINIARPSYWTFDGINITYNPNTASSYLLRITNGVGWTFKNGEIWGNRKISNVLINGTITGEPKDWTFTGNCVHDIGAGSGNPNNDHNMYVTPGYSSGPGLISRNVLWGVPNGNQIKAAGPSPSTGAANLRIQYNTMWKASQGVLVAYGSHHVSLYNNLIVQRWNGRADNPGIRGHELTGRTNVAANNLAYSYASVLLNSQGDEGRIRNGGGNARVNPVFDSVGSCNGFTPTKPAAAAYGHLAP